MDDDADSFEVPGSISEEQAEVIATALSVTAMRAHESGHVHERQRTRAQVLVLVGFGLLTALLAAASAPALWPVSIPWGVMALSMVVAWYLDTDFHRRRRAEKSTVDAAERLLRGR